MKRRCGVVLGGLLISLCAVPTMAEDTAANKPTAEQAQLQRAAVPLIEFAGWCVTGKGHDPMVAEVLAFFEKVRAAQEHSGARSTGSD